LTIRSDIESTFRGELFQRPLFYSYHQALRFKLSDKGSSIERFLCALDRALAVSKSVFALNDTLTVCVRTWSYDSQFSHRQTIKEFRNAGIKVLKPRCIWAQKNDDEDPICINVAFVLSASLLQNLLWCAIATDFGFIRPSPRCSISS
jgi:hypothetical protein